MSRSVLFLVFSLFVGSCFCLEEPYLKDYTKDNQFLVKGTGATFPVPILSEWIFAYTFKRPLVAFSYAATGSGAGITAQIQGTYDYSGSDAIPTTAQKTAAAANGKHLQLYPWIGGSVVPFVNFDNTAFPSVRCFNYSSLALNGTTIAKIFAGIILQWDDPEILEQIPNINLTCIGTTQIYLYLRGDGSGTTEVFANALKAVYPQWPFTVGQRWDTNLTNACKAQNRCTLVDGSYALVGNVLTRQGAIGYASYGYALEAETTPIGWRNQAGFVTDPVKGTAAAMANTTLKADNSASLINSPLPDAYPSAAFSYLLLNVNNANTTTDRCEKLAEVVKFVRFVLTDEAPRERAEIAGFVPVALTLVDPLLIQLDNLTCNGKELPLDFKQAIPSYVPAVILALAAIGLLGCLILYPIMFLYRRSPHFIYGDLDFLVLILFGAMLVFIGLILFGSFPDEGGQEGPLCMGTAWLVILGGTILYVSLILKILRIYYTVVPSKKLQKSKVALTFGMMFAILCTILVPVIIVLAVWNGVEPVTTTHTDLTEYDQYYVVCYVENFWWPIGFVIAGAVLMIFGAYVATKTRSLAPGFNESGPLALSIYNAIVIAGVIVLLMFILDNPPVVTIIFGIGVFIIAFVPIVLIYPPKVYRAMKGTAFKLSKQIKGRCGRCFADCPHCTSSNKSPGSQGTVARSSARTSVSRSQGDDA